MRICDSDDSLFDVIDSVSDLLNNSSQNNNLLHDGWFLRSWSGVVGVLKLNNLLVDDCDLLGVFNNLLLENFDDLLLDDSQRFW